MFSFNSQFLKVDVTATKIHEIFFLVGIGCYLHIFDKKTLKSLNKLKVFEDQKIYGIIINKANNKILLYGGLSIKVFEVNSNLTYFEEISQAISVDWILDAKWIDNDKEIATISMHNKLHVWNENLEIITEIECEEKCILYSAQICYDRIYDLVILSGTVFSEVLIWTLTKWEKGAPAVLIRLKKHSGVIFSVHYNEKSGYLCSSSDDRSAILWKIKSKSLHSELEKQNIIIKPVCQVYGHLSRIFRCRVLKNCFITGGEDSLLNIWSFHGQLIRKVETHQGAPVWAIDVDEKSTFILTGGGDGGVTTFPVNAEFEELNVEIPNKGVPKSVGILASSNLVAISEIGVLYYIKKKQKCQIVQAHEDLKSYALLVVSNCKMLVALAGLQGQVYLYKEAYGRLQYICSFESKLKSRIFSLHWLNCRTLLICQAGGKMLMLYLKNNRMYPVSSFILPPSKERWATTAVFVKNDNLVVGDRKGNIHLFQFGKVEAVQTVKKAHSHLGVTNLISEDRKIKSLGRNGIMKTFLLKKGTLHLLSSEKLPFTWLVNIIDSLLLAFSGDNFVIWSYEAKRLIFEKSCGGGHRSWHFFKKSNTVSFSYIKDKIINVVGFKLNDLLPTNVVEGYHVREINEIQTINISDKFVIISGGEDTSLRLNLADANNISNLISLKSHLSSIRAITKFKVSSRPDKNKESYLLFSAGGRAQVVCWKLHIFTENGAFKNILCSEQHSYYKSIQSEESEMRIMDLCVTKIENSVALFCACSDGNIKVFSVGKDNTKKYHLLFCQDVFYKLKCIIKICNINIFSHNIIVTMATDGKLVFWDVTNIFHSTSKLEPFHNIIAHQSGINSSAFKLLKNNLCLFITGGDDNAVVINLFRFYMVNKLMKIENLHSFIDTGTHCAQITGIFLGDKYFVTAAIDQRVAIFEWHIQNKQIICKYVTKYNTSVADVQGLNCSEYHGIDALVYGKGIEYIKIKKKPCARFPY